MPPISFDVQVTGRGPPMVLVAGAACGGVVWAGAVAHFRARYELHVLQLGGFAGRPRIEAPLLATARHELADYLGASGRGPAVLVGHSLGAFLVYATIADAPDCVSAGIAIDGVPALGQTLAPRCSPAEIERTAGWRRRRLAGLTPEKFRRYLAGAFRSMVVEPSDADEIVERGGRSDPSAVADAMYELWTTDLRPLLPSIDAPLLFIAPEWPVVELRRCAARLELYRQQLAAVPNHRLVVVEGARHFVMPDQPEALYREMDRFLEGG